MLSAPRRPPHTLDRKCRPCLPDITPARRPATHMSVISSGLLRRLPLVHTYILQRPLKCIVISSFMACAASLCLRHICLTVHCNASGTYDVIYLPRNGLHPLTATCICSIPQFIYFAIVCRRMIVIYDCNRSGNWRACTLETALQYIVGILFSFLSAFLFLFCLRYLRADQSILLLTYGLGVDPQSRV